MSMTMILTSRNLLRRKVVLLALMCNVFLGWRCNSSFVNAKEFSTTTTNTGKASDKSNKGIKGRKLNGGEGFYNWRKDDATFSEAQYRKKEDSQEDSVRYCQKIRDKHGITCVPSAQPSSMPSEAPTVSMAPTLSVAPSYAPSDIPSSPPTSTPSKEPTGVPSSSPSKLPTGQPSEQPTDQPSVPPTLAPTRVQFETLFLSREDGSQWQDNTCQTALPAGATQLQTEETRFEYFLILKTNAEPDINMKHVEQSLATAMAEEILTCQFDGSNTQYPFETYSFTSLPVDERGEANLCPDNVRMDGTDCYVIRGGFTPTLFYLEKRVRQRRRQLYINRSFSSQSQSEIVEVFGPILQSLLDSNTFVSGDILKTTYSGFLLGNTQGSGSGGTGVGGATTFDTTTTVAIQGNSNNNNGNSDGGTPTGFVFGAIAICVAVVSLIVVSAVLLRRRRDAKRKRAFELCEDDGQLDLDPSAEIDPQALPNQYDTRSVLQEGFPGDNTTYNHNAAAPIQDVESMPVQSKTYSSGRFGNNLIDDDDDEVSSEVEARRAVSGLKYSVVNDEATFDESLLDLDSSAGNDPHDYTHCKSPTCFKCRSKNMKQPTFVQADLQAIQSDLGSNKKYRPKYNRQYAADDTVNL